MRRGGTNLLCFTALIALPSVVSVVKGTMAEFNEAEGPCSTVREVAPGTAALPRQLRSVIRVCVSQLCELCMGIMTRRS